MKTGDKLPDFSLPDANNQWVSSKEFAGKKVVIFFYPKDHSPGCTKEVCSFRDAYEDFKEAGAEVIGISSDSPESHRMFMENLRVPFILLSDVEGKVRKLFGVKNNFLFIPGRETFVFDEKGTLVYKFRSGINFDAHCKKALEVVKK